MSSTVTKILPQPRPSVQRGSFTLPSLVTATPMKRAIAHAMMDDAQLAELYREMAIFRQAVIDAVADAASEISREQIARMIASDR